MKYLLLITLIMTSLFVIKLFKQQQEFSNGTVEQIITPTVVPDAKIGDYAYSSLILTNKDIKLLSNLKTPLDGATLKVKYGCDAIVNGGFYDKENNHIGLFVENGKMVNAYQKNALFNGFIYIDAGEITMSTEIVRSSDYATQTGPVIIYEGNNYSFKLSNDDYSRRVIYIEYLNGLKEFLVLYRNDNKYLGPKLSEVYDLLANYSKNNGVEIKNAINLDGGFHSLFVNDKLTLSEASFIGSFFCIN